MMMEDKGDMALPYGLPSLARSRNLRAGSKAEAVIILPSP